MAWVRKVKICKERLVRGSIRVGGALMIIHLGMLEKNQRKIDGLFFLWKKNQTGGGLALRKSVEGASN